MAMTQLTGCLPCQLRFVFSVSRFPGEYYLLLWTVV
jgi:hypothetical protein